MKSSRSTSLLPKSLQISEATHIGDNDWSCHRVTSLLDGIRYQSWAKATHDLRALDNMTVKPFPSRAMYPYRRELRVLLHHLQLSIAWLVGKSPGEWHHRQGPLLHRPWLNGNSFTYSSLLKNCVWVSSKSDYFIIIRLVTTCSVAPSEELFRFNI